MKAVIFLLMIVGAFSAAVPQKAVIVTYPDDTPDHILSDAKDAIIAAGGFITHEYMFFKGFAAKASMKVLESVQAWGANFNVVVEEDQVVEVAGASRD